MQDEEDEFFKVIKILRKHKAPTVIPFIPLPEVDSDSEGESTELADPPFEATVISPPNSPLTVYLGSVSDAMYPAALKARNITAVINMAGRQCRDVQRIQKFSADEATSQWDRIAFSAEWYRAHAHVERYLVVDAEDHPRYRIVGDFELCLDWLAEAETKNSGAVLVHCMQGLNRSAAVCAAWLSRRFEIDTASAAEMIASKRPGVLSNRGFVRQLIQFRLPKIQHEEKKETPKIVDIGNIVERFP